jgi:hypothetical protein
MQAIARIAEQRILRAIKDGVLDNLEGAGKPLDLNDDAWVPEDLRLAFRVLRNAGLIPPELELRNEIMNLRALVDTIDDDKERLKRFRELNYKLMCLNELRKKPLRLEDFPAYEQEIVERLTGG